MSSKYSGLPDIDTAPDVFETPDEPEAVLRPNDNGFGDEDVITKPQSELIDASGLPARRKAERIFGRGSRRTDSSTFKPRIPPLRRYRSGSSSSDDLPMKETPAARLRRLKAELEEVEKDIQAESSRSKSRPETEEKENGKRKSVLPPREPLDLFGELAGLRERIAEVDIGANDSCTNPTVPSTMRDRLERLSHHPPSTVTDPPHEAEVSTIGPAGLSDIDKRLASLENLIGPCDPTFEALSSPLCTTLDKHDHLLTLLTQPRHLDAISRRVKLLLVDLDRAAAAARRQPNSAPSQPTDKTVTISTSDYAALQNLFNLLPRLDPLLPIVPPLLARLRSLAGLHASAGEIVENLNRLKEVEKQGSEEAKELRDVVEGVQRGLDDAGKTILSNWEGVEKRVKDLEERLKKLDH